MLPHWYGMTVGKIMQYTVTLLLNPPNVWFLCAQAPRQWWNHRQLEKGDMAPDQRLKSIVFPPRSESSMGSSI